jgi:16S rRNA C1402 N4-methylase RsmH
VLGRPAVDFLKVRDGGVYIDATFGAGGYSAAILGLADAQVIGIDRMIVPAVPDATGSVLAPPAPR